jgi:transposase
VDAAPTPVAVEGADRTTAEGLPAHHRRPALPERFGPRRTVATRFYRWTRSGLWDRILAELRRIADAVGGIDWDLHMVDGTSVRLLALARRYRG